MDQPAAENGIVQGGLTNLHAVAPTSLLGEALYYLHGQWLKLIRFLKSDSWPLDSSPVENATPHCIGVTES
ncbi:IS66 family transposase [Achromobacter kerstersii]